MTPITPGAPVVVDGQLVAALAFGELPTTAASIAEGVIAFMNAAFGLRLAAFGAGRAETNSENATTGTSVAFNP